MLVALHSAGETGLVFLGIYVCFSIGLLVTLLFQCGGRKKNTKRSQQPEIRKTGRGTVSASQSRGAVTADSKSKGQNHELQRKNGKEIGEKSGVIVKNEKKNKGGKMGSGKKNPIDQDAMEEEAEKGSDFEAKGEPTSIITLGRKNSSSNSCKSIGNIDSFEKIDCTQTSVPVSVLSKPTKGSTATNKTKGSKILSQNLNK